MAKSLKNIGCITIHWGTGRQVIFGNVFTVQKLNTTTAKKAILSIHPPVNPRAKTIVRIWKLLAEKEVKKVNYIKPTK